MKNLLSTSRSKSAHLHGSESVLRCACSSLGDSAVSTAHRVSGSSLGRFCQFQIPAVVEGSRENLVVAVADHRGIRKEG